jgi:hypothetical protein
MGWRPHGGNYGHVPTEPIVEWKCVLAHVPRRGFSLTLVNAVTLTHLDGSPAERSATASMCTSPAAEFRHPHGCPLSSEELLRIAARIAMIDAVAADQFLQGSQLLEQCREADGQHAEAKRQAVLEPFRDVIQAYVAALYRTCGCPLYGYKSVRVKHFMEQFVLAHGWLPTVSTVSVGIPTIFSCVRPPVANIMSRSSLRRTIAPTGCYHWGAEIERITGVSRHELRPDLSRIFGGQRD